MKIENNAMGAKLAIVKALGSKGAPRVVDHAALLAWLEHKGLKVAAVTLSAALPSLCEAGALQRARHGIYLNKLIKPATTMEEIAPWLRQTAVVSLHRVLGRYGVINNPTNWITCVVSSDKTRKVGMLKTPMATFTFNAIKDEFFAPPGSDWENDALEPFAQTPTATPEKALMDWLYLAETARSQVIAPAAHDLDLSGLDRGRLERLAKRMGLESALEKLTSKALGAAKEADEFQTATTKPRSLQP